MWANCGMSEEAGKHPGRLRNFGRRQCIQESQRKYDLGFERIAWRDQELCGHTGETTAGERTMTKEESQVHNSSLVRAVYSVIQSYYTNQHTPTAAQCLLMMVKA